MAVLMFCFGFFVSLSRIVRSKKLLLSLPISYFPISNSSFKKTTLLPPPFVFFGGGGVIGGKIESFTPESEGLWGWEFSYPPNLVLGEAGGT